MASESKASLPLHPQFTHFPLALWLTSLLFDGLSFWLGNSMVQAAFFNISVGCVIGLATALTGALDYSYVPDSSPAKRMGLLHGGLNVMAFTLFAVSLWPRAMSLSAPSTPIAPLIISVIGVTLVSVSGWLGGRMVYEMGVGTPAEKLLARGGLRSVPAEAESAQSFEARGFPSDQPSPNGHLPSGPRRPPPSSPDSGPERHDPR